MFLIKNGRVFTEGCFKKLDILIDDQKIKVLKKNIKINPTCTEVIDAKNKLVTPGFIDLHVHLREPGFTHKETIFTGTWAAAKGGFTTIAAMPNTDPVIDNKEVLRKLKQQIEEDAVVKVYPYGSISKEEKGVELVDFSAMARDVIAFSDDGKGIQNKELMREAMGEIKKFRKRIVAHCEAETLINNGYIHEGSLSKQLGVKGITSASEYLQLERDLKLAEETGVAYHVCHLSTKESVELIRKAKKQGIDVSCEVTPHHLLLTEDDIDIYDSNYKMNPPLRSKADQLALLEGVQDGTIDIIVTDHAPHHAAEKARGFEDAPFGIVGLETCFPLLYTNLVLKGFISLERLIEMLTIKPAALFALDSGVLEVGKEADLTIIDPEQSFIIKAEEFYSKGKNSPFIGDRCQGSIVATFVQGKEIVSGGSGKWNGI